MTFKQLGIGLIIVSVLIISGILSMQDKEDIQKRSEDVQRKALCYEMQSKLDAVPTANVASKSADFESQVEDENRTKQEITDTYRHNYGTAYIDKIIVDCAKNEDGEWTLPTPSL